MNQILTQTKDAIIQKADERLRGVIDKVVEAGKKVLYSPETREMSLKQMAAGSDPENIGAGVAKLMGVLFNQSKNTIPMEALIPASVVLLCEVLGFMEEGGAVQVSSEFLAECAKAMSSNLLQLLGATPEQIGSYFAKGQGQPSPSPAPAPGGIVSGAM